MQHALVVGIGSRLWKTFSVEPPAGLCRSVFDQTASQCSVGELLEAQVTLLLIPMNWKS